MQHYYDQVQNAVGTALPGVNVSVFNAGTTVLATIYADNFLTSKLNPTTTDTLGRFDFYVVDGRYDLSFSGGGVTPYTKLNIEISDLTQASSNDTPWQTDALTVQGGVTLGEISAGFPPANGSILLYPKTSDNKLYYMNSSGVEIGPLTTTTGGSSPVGSVNSIQKNAGGGLFGSTAIVDNGTNITHNEDTIFTGPTPWFDIRAYGARVGNISGTASMTAGSTACTLGSSYAFVNGDGVTIYGAGPTCSLAAPGGVTVTPAQSIVMNGPAFATATGGGTSYSYQVVAVDNNGGVSPASAVVTTITGAATLGAKTATITTQTRFNNLVTVTTSAPHGFAVGASVTIPSGTVSDFTFSGAYIVSAVTANTFQYVSGMDTRAGASASSTGGTATVFTCNRVAWSIVPGAFRYYVYKSGVCVGQPAPFDLFWDDYGGLSTYLFTPPAWLPAAPPSAPTNDYLTTTIVSGAGTTSLTLTAAAVNTVTANRILQDSTPGILAACAARATAGNVGSVYIPATNSSFFINSSLSLPGNISVPMSVLQAGVLIANETISLSQGMSWIGVINAGGEMSFQQSPLAIISGSAAPLLYGNGTIMHLENLELAGGLGNQQSALVVDRPTTWTAINCLFGHGGAEGDQSVFVVLRGGFGFVFERCEFFGANTPFFGNTLAPTLMLRAALAQTGGTEFTGLVQINNSSFINRGMGIDATGASTGQISVSMHNILTEDLITPLAMLQTYSFIGNLVITDLAQADTGSVIAANWGGGQVSLLATGSGFGGAIVPVYSGNPFAGIVTNAASPEVPGVITMGQNINCVNIGESIGFFVNAQPPYNSLNFVAGGGATNFLQTMTAFRQPVHFPAQHSLFWDLPPVTGVSVTVQSGGSIPVGVYTYYIQVLGADGGLSTPRTSQSSTTATTTLGNQTVLVSWNAVLGAKGYQVWRFSTGTGFGTTGGVVTTNSFTDTNSFQQNSSAPYATGTGVVTVNNSGVITPLSQSYGGVTSGIKAVTTTYTTTINDTVILANGTGGGFTITLLAASLNGQFYRIKKTDATAAVITISPGSGTIDGSGSKTLSTQYSSYDIQFDGSNWWIL